jgi:hypothetical protein
VGRHRKRHARRHRRRVRIALVSTGLLIPLAGGAVVFAATAPGGRPAASRPRSHATATRHVTHRTDPGAPLPAQAAPSSPPSPQAPERPAPPPSPPPGPRIGFAPYADVLTWPPLDLSKTDVKAYTMGFVAAGGGCSAAWGGLSPVDAAFAVHRIEHVPGKVVLAFGGPHGTELSQSCTGVDALVKQYRRALDATHPAGVDFYLTEGMLSDTDAVRRWTEAVARVERDQPRPLSVTLPLHTSGLSASALAALRSAADGGLAVAIVNLVPADGAGQSITASATAVHGQLQRLYDQDDAQVWQRMGLTPIIGVAGAGDQFGPADARELLAWATEHRLGRLSMWSVTRDTPCTADTSVTADTCSGLDEDSGVFTRVFQPF